MTEFVDLGSAARRLAESAARLTDDQLGEPTPCAGTDVAGLLHHLLMLAAAFRDAARRLPDPGPPPPHSGERLDPDWRRTLPQRLDELVAAWRDPGAYAGTVSVGGVEMAARETAVVALDELVLHGWDLAMATGRSYECDPATAETCYSFVSVAASPEGVPGLFGPIVPVPDDAPLFDRLLGLSGRDPGWAGRASRLRGAEPG